MRSTNKKVNKLVKFLVSKSSLKTKLRLRSREIEKVKHLKSPLNTANSRKRQVHGAAEYSERKTNACKVWCRYYLHQFAGYTKRFTVDVTNSLSSPIYNLLEEARKLM